MHAPVHLLIWLKVMDLSQGLSCGIGIWHCWGVNTQPFVSVLSVYDCTEWMLVE